MDEKPTDFLEAYGTLIKFKLLRNYILSKQKGESTYHKVCFVNLQYF